MKSMKKLLIVMMCMVSMGSFIACSEDSTNDSNVNSATDGTKDDTMLEDAADKVEDDMKEGVDDMKEGADEMMDNSDNGMESENEQTDER